MKRTSCPKCGGDRLKPTPKGDKVECQDCFWKGPATVQ